MVTLVLVNEFKVFTLNSGRMSNKPTHWSNDNPYLFIDSPLSPIYLHQYYYLSY